MSTVGSNIETTTSRASFRSATAADRAAIAALLASQSLPLAGVDGMLDGDATQFIVAEDPDDRTSLVAVAGVEVCEQHALLRSVAVRADWQRRGLGQELVRRAVCEAEARGIRALYLLTLTAEHYFPRFGFERVGRDTVPDAIAATLEFRSACPASAVCMSRDLA